MKWTHRMGGRKHSLQIKVRVSQPFRCYETPQCLDRTEQVCALKERRGRNRLRKFQKFNIAFELKTNRLCTPFRECWEKPSSRHMKHNTMSLAFFEGTRTTNTRHCSRITLLVQRPCLPCPFQSRGTSGIQPGRGRCRWGRSHRTRGPSFFWDSHRLCCRTPRDICLLCTDFPS